MEKQETELLIPFYDMYHSWRNSIFESYEETFYLPGTHLKEVEGTAHVAQNHIRMESCGMVCLEDTLTFVLSISICFHLGRDMS